MNLGDCKILVDGKWVGYIDAINFQLDNMTKGFIGVSTAMSNLNDSVKITCDTLRANHENMKKAFPLLYYKSDKWNKRRRNKRMRRGCIDLKIVTQPIEGEK